MFCFQCEQKAKDTACTVAGVCGKKADTANLQDEIIAKLIDLVELSDDSNIDDIILETLFLTITNVNFDDEDIMKYIKRIDDLRAKYPESKKMDMNELWNANEDIRSLKSLILFSIKGTAAYAKHAKVLGYEDSTITAYFKKALIAIKNEEDADKLLELVLEAGNINLIAMELLDKANTSTFGNPEPVEVSMNIEKGPFIVVTGHDLLDLHELLKQSKDKGVNIYSHGEMLPCHGYPKLKEFEHFKGNFGTAWQNQQKEFDNIPASILYTTNCIMPVRDSYKDRVFTTSVVAYPETQKISIVDGKKDFSKLIEKAIELGGYEEERKMQGINGGDKLLTGFGHHTVLSIADKLIESIKKGNIKHIFLVGGCDGAKTGRNYYTEFVKKAPKDSIILTLACGKFRFNDLDLGDIDGIPRIVDMGQCNDAYSAIKVAVALAEAFECSVNDLPLTMVLSWYEQKAVSILLTLLALDIKNIYLGPTLPAFVSENILNVLVEKWNISPISTPEEDLKKILA